MANAETTLSPCMENCFSDYESVCVCACMCVCCVCVLCVCVCEEEREMKGEEEEPLKEKASRKQKIMGGSRD